ncbi:PREDICTED: uncharacterized protein LOC107353969 isoform X1 [Acropora digitifera]|uniref:uncharacterized protein LOC107353969 isoform X1 n=2 Tax=Acropora digitifera TaxID=70779 RepID=UPI00077A5D6F|nr:PREDICTED: uncharacterized protein LOC107353969 isoform X1 [Acropora digitifera]
MTSKKKSSRFTEQMNAVLIDSYSKHQVKKRWEDITMQVKKKERTARHNEINRLKITGNGKLPDDQEESEVITIPVTQSLASSPERKVAQILGPEVFEGISGGLDTLDTSGWLDRQPQFSTSTASMVAGADGMASVDLDADVKQLDQPQNLKEMTSKSIKGRKRSLADAQIEYFEVCTSYYKLKKEKVCLEMKALQGHKEGKVRSIITKIFKQVMFISGINP